MAGEMGQIPGWEFSCVISVGKMLSLWWRLWCPSTTQVSCSNLEGAWPCPGAAGQALPWLISCPPILSWTVTWIILLHQHKSSANVPRRECLNKKMPLYHSSRSVCRRKGLVQGRNEQLGSGTGPRNVSFSRAAAWCPCKQLWTHRLTLPSSAEFDRLRLFLACVLPVRHSHRRILAALKLWALGVVALPSNLNGCFQPDWWRN